MIKETRFTHLKIVRVRLIFKQLQRSVKWRISLLYVYENRVRVVKHSWSEIYEACCWDEEMVESDRGRMALYMLKHERRSGEA